MDKTQTQTRTRTPTQTWTWNWNTFVTYPYDIEVPIALYGLFVTHHSTNSNVAIKLVAPLPDENYDMQILKRS